jgi:hypothetical protein
LTPTTLPTGRYNIHTILERHGYPSLLDTTPIKINGPTYDISNEGLSYSTSTTKFDIFITTTSGTPLNVNRFEVVLTGIFGVNIFTCTLETAILPNMEKQRITVVSPTAIPGGFYEIMLYGYVNSPISSIFSLFDSSGVILPVFTRLSSNGALLNGATIQSNRLQAIFADPTMVISNTGIKPPTFGSQPMFQFSFTTSSIGNDDIFKAFVIPPPGQNFQPSYTVPLGPEFSNKSGVYSFFLPPGADPIREGSYTMSVGIFRNGIQFGSSNKIFYEINPPEITLVPTSGYDSQGKFGVGVRMTTTNIIPSDIYNVEVRDDNNNIVPVRIRSTTPLPKYDVTDYFAIIETSSGTPLQHTQTGYKVSISTPRIRAPMTPIQFTSGYASYYFDNVDIPYISSAVPMSNLVRCNLTVANYYEATNFYITPELLNLSLFINNTNFPLSLTEASKDRIRAVARDPIRFTVLIEMYASDGSTIDSNIPQGTRYLELWLRTYQSIDIYSPATLQAVAWPLVIDCFPPTVAIDVDGLSTVPGQTYIEFRLKTKNIPPLTTSDTFVIKVLDNNGNNIEVHPANPIPTTPESNSIVRLTGVTTPITFALVNWFDVSVTIGNSTSSVRVIPYYVTIQLENTDSIHTVGDNSLDFLFGTVDGISSDTYSIDITSINTLRRTKFRGFRLSPLTPLSVNSTKQPFTLVGFGPIKEWDSNRIYPINSIVKSRLNNFSYLCKVPHSSKDQSDPSSDLVRWMFFDCLHESSIETFIPNQKYPSGSFVYSTLTKNVYTNLRDVSATTLDPSSNPNEWELVPSNRLPPVVEPMTLTRATYELKLTLYRQSIASIVKTLNFDVSVAGLMLANSDIIYNVGDSYINFNISAKNILPTDTYTVSLSTESGTIVPVKVNSEMNPLPTSSVDNLLCQLISSTTTPLSLIKTTYLLTISLFREGTAIFTNSSALSIVVGGPRPSIGIGRMARVGDDNIQFILGIANLTSGDNVTAILTDPNGVNISITPPTSITSSSNLTAGLSMVMSSTGTPLSLIEGKYLLKVRVQRGTYSITTPALPIDASYPTIELKAGTNYALASDINMFMTTTRVRDTDNFSIKLKDSNGNPFNSSFLVSTPVISFFPKTDSVEFPFSFFQNGTPLSLDRSGIYKVQLVLAVPGQSDILSNEVIINPLFPIPRIEFLGNLSGVGFVPTRITSVSLPYPCFEFHIYLAFAYSKRTLDSYRYQVIRLSDNRDITNFLTYRSSTNNTIPDNPLGTITLAFDDYVGQLRGMTPRYYFEPGKYSVTLIYTRIDSIGQPYDIATSNTLEFTVKSAPPPTFLLKRDLSVPIILPMQPSITFLLDISETYNTDTFITTLINATTGNNILTEFTFNSKLGVSVTGVTPVAAISNNTLTIIGPGGVPLNLSGGQYKLTFSVVRFGTTYSKDLSFFVGLNPTIRLSSTGIDYQVNDSYINANLSIQDIGPTDTFSAGLLDPAGTSIAVTISSTIPTTDTQSALISIVGNGLSLQPGSYTLKLYVNRGLEQVSQSTLSINVDVPSIELNVVGLEPPSIGENSFNVKITTKRMLSTDTYYVRIVDPNNNQFNGTFNSPFGLSVTDFPNKITLPAVPGFSIIAGVYQLKCYLTRGTYTSQISVQNVTVVTSPTIITRNIDTYNVSLRSYVEVLITTTNISPTDTYDIKLTSPTGSILSTQLSTRPTDNVINTAVQIISSTATPLSLIPGTYSLVIGVKRKSLIVNSPVLTLNVQDSTVVINNNGISSRQGDTYLKFIATTTYALITDTYELTLKNSSNQIIPTRFKAANPFPPIGQINVTSQTFEIESSTGTQLNLNGAYTLTLSLVRGANKITSNQLNINPSAPTVTLNDKGQSHNVGDYSIGCYITTSEILSTDTFTITLKDPNGIPVTQGAAIYRLPPLTIPATNSLIQIRSTSGATTGTTRLQLVKGIYKMSISAFRSGVLLSTSAELSIYVGLPTINLGTAANTMGSTSLNATVTTTNILVTNTYNVLLKNPSGVIVPVIISPTTVIRPNVVDFPFSLTSPTSTPLSLVKGTYSLTLSVAASGYDVATSVISLNVN